MPGPMELVLIGGLDCPVLLALSMLPVVLFITLRKKP